KAQLAEIQSQRVESTDAVHQLEQLTKALKLPWTGTLPKITAQVISGPRSNFSHAVEINKGSDQGLAVGMPAVTAGGLVGKVSEVAPGPSTIDPIPAPAFLGGVRRATTGALGTASGQGTSQPLVVDTSLTADSKVPAGVPMVTSGVDRSAFPG